METNMLKSNQYGQSQIKRHNPYGTSQSIPLNQILSSEKRLSDDQIETNSLGRSRSNPKKNNSIDIDSIMAGEMRDIPIDHISHYDQYVKPKSSNSRSPDLERVRSWQHEIKDMLPNGEFQVDDLDEICRRFGFYQYHLANHLVELGLITRLDVNLFRKNNF
jgi:hypothetical protein